MALSQSMRCKMIEFGAGVLLGYVVFGTVARYIESRVRGETSMGEE